MLLGQLAGRKRLRDREAAGIDEARDLLPGGARQQLFEPVEIGLAGAVGIGAVKDVIDPVEGAGRDLQTAGEAITDEAQDAQSGM